MHAACAAPAASLRPVAASSRVNRRVKHFIRADAAGLGLPVLARPSGEPAIATTPVLHCYATPRPADPVHDHIRAIEVELVTGRLAMLGVSYAAWDELSTKHPVLTQLADGTPFAAAALVLLAVASFIPLLRGEEPDEEAFGPFNLRAELANGRCAMVALSTMVIAEAFKGAALL